jgi:hypothetical protein
MACKRVTRSARPRLELFTGAISAATRAPGLDSPSEKLPEQAVHLLRRVLLRPVGDTRQPLDAQIADVAPGAIKAWKTQRDVLFAIRPR